MKIRNIIYLINILLLTIITILSRYEKSHLDILGNAIGVFFLVILNLTISLFFYFIKMKEFSKTFLLSGGIILLVGFSSCFAIEYLR